MIYITRILKNKSLIVFLLVFTLSFGVITDYKQKQTQAAFVIDDITLITLAFTVLATGVIANNNNQLKHMGSMMWDRMVDMGVSSLDQISKMDHSGNRQILMNNVVKESALWVAQNLPTQPVRVAQNSIAATNSFTTPIGFIKLSTEDYTNLFGKLKREDILKYATVVFNANGNINLKSKNDNFVFYHKGLVALLPLISLEGNKRFYAFTLTDGYSTGSWKNYLSYLDGWEFSATITGEMTDLKEYTDIPFDVTMKDNYNETVINTRLPWNVGIDEVKDGTTIGTIPTNAPVIDRVINGTITDTEPLVWDDVKDVVTDKVISGDIVTDKVVDDTITGDDTVTDNTGLWGWLKDLLKTILDTLTGILDFLLDMLKALLNGLKDLLLSLFVPSDTFLQDNVISLKNKFGAKLPYSQYTSLFDSNYSENSIKDLTVNIFGQEVVIVRFTLYYKFKDTIDNLIYAFMFFLLAIYNYSQVYKLIRGSDYVSASSTITHMGGGMTHNDVLKADSISQRTQKMIGRRG